MTPHRLSPPLHEHRTPNTLSGALQAPRFHALGFGFSAFDSQLRFQVSAATQHTAVVQTAGPYSNKHVILSALSVYHAPPLLTTELPTKESPWVVATRLQI
jgi:hypothetical protein